MLLDKLAFIENKYDELSVKISDPAIIANQSEWRKLCKEQSDLEIIVNVYKEYRDVVEDLQANKEMLFEETDREMKEMMQEEVATLTARNEELKDEIRITVIATGFESDNAVKQNKPVQKAKVKETIVPNAEVAYTKDYEDSDLEIPAFLRRQNK